MRKINILDSAVFNRIAAGEVVENPRSVVKELVENSIDAGADNIAVEIRGGGIDYICVSDNGKGIDREDMPVAFLPHATSKIRDVQDLDAIRTLGFRGEALPSIASVADVEMISRIPESELGYRVSMQNGSVAEQGECGAPLGTKITVRRLFGSVPARAKFLRKPQSEESAVTEWIEKIILAEPQLKIKYIVDGTIRCQSDGNGIESAVYSVYGAQFLQNLAPISYTSSDIQLSGLIGKPDFTKHNRLYQTLIVNGRYIINSEISYCIQQCYLPYLMKRQFPVYILYLNVPTDTIDVNVHPNKLDVRFANEKRIKGVLYNTIKAKIDALAREPIAHSPSFMPVEKENTAEVEITATVSQRPNVGLDRIDPVFTQTTENKMAETGIIRTRLQNFVQEAIYSPMPDRNTAKAPSEKITATPTPLFIGDLPIRYVGKLFNTYLLAENGENFYIIDQHAAHEKLLYDKLLQQAESGDMVVQDLLVPYIFDVSPSENVKLREQLAEINACGFKIDALNGCSFSLYALPVCCSDLNLQQFVALLLDDSDMRKNGVVFQKERLMQAACKSAVKGEDDLTENEIECLIKQMQASGSARFCPHGRPTVIQCKRSDLEKAFKRLV
ncbi:MAG: DNA mismatch repair endonuclease MutL [Clostridia bacterium]|nr:DNA mismatch repair endonuclease MutL [Clostridia bacterium]